MVSEDNLIALAEAYNHISMKKAIVDAEISMAEGTLVDAQSTLNSLRSNRSVLQIKLDGIKTQIEKYDPQRLITCL